MLTTKTNSKATQPEQQLGNTMKFTNNILFVAVLANKIAYGQATPERMVDSLDLENLKSWVQGLDETLDEAFVNRASFFSGTAGLRGAGESAVSSFGAGQEDEIMKSEVSKAFASQAGRQRARDLIAQGNGAFQAFEANAKSVWQTELCEIADNPLSQASSDLADCLCGRTDDAFVACTAVLEQEIEAYSQRRERERRKLASNGEDGHGYIHQARKLARCKSDDDEDDGKNGPPLDSALDAFADLLGESGPISKEIECSAPIPGLPLEIQFGISATIPGIADFQNFDTHEVSSEVKFEFNAEVCLLGESFLSGPSKTV